MFSFLVVVVVVVVLPRFMADAPGVRAIKSMFHNSTDQQDEAPTGYFAVYYGFKWRRGVFSVKTEGPLMIEARQFQAQLKKISGF